MFSLDDFIISDGVLTEYRGNGGQVVIPGGVKKIGDYVFLFNETVTSVTLPEGLIAIGYEAFCYCRNLKSVEIPGSVVKFEDRAFEECQQLSEATIRKGVSRIGNRAFFNCFNLSSIKLPDGVKTVGYSTFEGCFNLCSADMPKSLTEIGNNAFSGCSKLALIHIPETVKMLGDDVFGEEPVTVVCKEGSVAHRYCEENDYRYVFDYQFEAFGGVLPAGYEKIAAPFPADEEKPNIFISYSHKDREKVLTQLKKLYEDGWKIWYDDGLTIGNRYDQVLEEHVRDCGAVLLFVTENSVKSSYINENEIPWAISYSKPIIKCIVNENTDLIIEGGDLITRVSPDEIGASLFAVPELVKGEPREARGLSVIVDPSARDAEEKKADSGFAYCIYSDKNGKNSAKARSIIKAARESGCAIYNAQEQGADDAKLTACSCLLAIVDNDFFKDAHLTAILEEKLETAAICQIEGVNEKDLPEKISKMQWLGYADGHTGDMNVKLFGFLQKTGCRDINVIPGGFEYDKTEKGIVIRNYSGMATHVRLEREYLGVPVVEIGDRAFMNCNHIKSVILPDSVVKIGNDAFCGAIELAELSVPGSVKEIGDRAFSGCKKLTRFAVPEGVTRIGKQTFHGCGALTSIVLPDSVSEIDEDAFSLCGELSGIVIPSGASVIADRTFFACKKLSSVVIPDGVARIGEQAFFLCESLSAVNIPDSAKVIGDQAFFQCSSLTGVAVPEGVEAIGDEAFCGCEKLESAVIPGRDTEIGYKAFNRCPALLCECPAGSRALKYCLENDVPVGITD